MSASPVVAVVDVGSNSIKLLVATRGPDGRLTALHSQALEARISAGLGTQPPRLGEGGMARGLDAIRELLAAAAPFAPERLALVATSAVRDAVNGADFRDRVAGATGHELRILAGGEEAAAIGRGLVSDPALDDLRNFYVLDLGGGSLECLAFRDRRVEQALSLPLGCVRLMEQFVPDPTAPLTADARTAIAAHTQITLVASGFQFNLDGGVAVATGGTVATVRAILGARAGRRAEETPAVIGLPELRALLEELAALDLPRRRLVAGLPPARADVLPVALATLIAVADDGGCTALRHSFRNLRWGLAAELLGR